MESGWNHETALPNLIRYKERGDGAVAVDYGPLPSDASWRGVHQPWIEGDRLRWRSYDRQNRSVTLPALASRQLVPFRAFILLGYYVVAGKVAEFQRGVLRFAKRWGPLGICEHGWLYGVCHEGCLAKFWDSRALAWHLNVRGIEPLDAWRHYTAQGYWTALAANTLLGPGHLTDEQLNELLVLADHEKRPVNEDVSALYKREKWDSQLVAQSIGQFMDGGGVRFGFEWFEGPQTAIRWQTIAGAIGLQLSALCCGGGAWATCSNCGMPHLRKTAPREGQKSYCTRRKCSKNAAWRNSKRKAKSQPAEGDVS